MIQLSLILILAGAIVAYLYRALGAGHSSDSSLEPRGRSVGYLMKAEASLAKLIEQTQHWDGHQREHAIHRLAEIHGNKVLATLIPRLNDWVPQVRSAAKAAFLRRLTAKNAATFVRLLPDIQHLDDCGRENHKPLICTVEEFLLSRDCLNEVVKGTNAEERAVSRACHALLLAGRPIAIERVIKLGISHPDPVIRLNSLRKVDDLPEREAWRYILLALRDRYPPARRLALKTYLASKPATNSVRPYLFDSAPSIREIATRELRRQGVAFETAYLEALDAPFAARQRAALWGVAFLGLYQYRDRIYGSLYSRYPSVRRQALLCLSKLEGDAAIPIVIDCLTDESPSVSKTAVTLCRRLSIQLDADQLMKILLPARSPSALSTCLSLVGSSDKWESLIFFLRATLLSSPTRQQDREHLTQALQNWDREFNKRQNLPTRCQAIRLEKLLQEQSSKATVSWFSRLDFYLRTTGVFPTETSQK